MKRVTGFMGMSALVLTFTLFAFGCASSGGAINENLVAGEGETLVTVERESSFVGAAIKYEVFVDGNKVLELSNGESGKVVVPNGEHTIYTRIMRPTADKPMSERLDFTADSTELHFTTKPAGNKAVLTED
jgi:hypothetical protein